jgi:hypothetical protein|tara:strand:- start:75 stop:413 length:339 start_codon:yes stop_codon:yes gene_type:complete
MNDPSKAASRIFYGTGFGLILACGFGLLEGRMEITTLGIGHIFLLLAVISIIVAYSLGREYNFLKSIYPNETENEMVERIKKEINEIEQDSAVGNAWAKLESQVLEKELEQE